MTGFFPPEVTLSALLSQVLSADHSCRETVARVLADRIVQGKPACSAETGSYCKARARLEETMLSGLTRVTAEELERDLMPSWLWKNRCVKLIDGSCVSMPDTPENQAEYPQPESQNPGTGFPLARVVAVISLATGAVLEFTIGPYQGKKTGEHALLRQLLHCFSSGDIALADCYYCSYFLIAMLLELGVDVVFRLHVARQSDFRRGQRLGKNDHIVTWDKPARPDWMNRETYQKMPDQLTIREVRDQRNGSGDDLIVATSLLSPKQYSKRKLIELYVDRWCIELDLRAIKSVMQMDILRCKTPEMVRKEIWAHLLAYNLIRKIIMQAAQKHELHPREISFTGALQTLNVFIGLCKPNNSVEPQALYNEMLDAIASHRVGNRPGRHEPRAVKRRPKLTRWLKIPRAQARRALI